MEETDIFSCYKTRTQRLKQPVIARHCQVCSGLRCEAGRRCETHASVAGWPGIIHFPPHLLAKTYEIQRTDKTAARRLLAD
jgi:hypothetical protein